jgi:hypothetical protein
MRGTQKLNWKAGSSLPLVTPFDRVSILVVESYVERACRVELNIDSGFVTQSGSEGLVEVTTATGKRKEIVLSICFNLWQQHSGRGERCFLAWSRSFNQTNIRHASHSESACDG